MANGINNLGAILQAIGRQIAFGKHSPARADRPEGDLPILLLPNPALGLTGSNRKRTEKNRPYLLGHPPVEPAPVEPAPVSPAAVTAPRMPAIRLPKHEGALLRLDPRTMRGMA